MLEFCDFFDCVEINGIRNCSDRPVIVGKMNIFWPAGWTREMARRYREEHGLAMPADPHRLGAAGAV